MKRIRLVLLALTTALLLAIPTTAHAEDKGLCKNGGWESVLDSNGGSFKNQGDCVSYVSTGGTFLVVCDNAGCWL